MPKATKQQLHEAFLEHLDRGERIKDEQRKQAIISFAENEMIEFIRKNLKSDFRDLYDETDIHLLSKLRSDILHKYPKENKDVSEWGYAGALAYYIHFLTSKLNPNRPIFKIPVEERSKPQSVVSPQPKDYDHQEGKIVQKNLTTHERNKNLRDQCIAHFKTLHHGRIVCECCGFDFGKAYGEWGEGYIEVHHLLPISQTEGQHNVNPEKDLVPLCANCHSVIHRGEEGVMSLDQLKERYKGVVYAEDNE